MADDLPNRLLEMYSNLIHEEEIEDCYPLYEIAEAAAEIQRLRAIISRMEANNG